MTDAGLVILELFMAVVLLAWIAGQVSAIVAEMRRSRRLSEAIRTSLERMQNLPSG
jgi:hypothetical protein